MTTTSGNPFKGLVISTDIQSTLDGFISAKIGPTALIHYKIKGRLSGRFDYDDCNSSTRLFIMEIPAANNFTSLVSALAPLETLLAALVVNAGPYESLPIGRELKMTPYHFEVTDSKVTLRGDFQLNLTKYIKRWMAHQAIAPSKLGIGVISLQPEETAVYLDLIHDFSVVEERDVLGLSLINQ